MSQSQSRKPYPSDVSDEEWAFVAPYLALVRGDAPQRRHDLREAFNAARWVAHTGAPWRWLPHDLPPWDIVHAQTRRWLAAGVFEALVADLRLLLRVVAGRNGQPSAAILDSRTLQSTPESGAAGRAGDSPQRPSSTWSPALFGQTDFLAAFLGGGKGTAKKGARPIQLALLVEGGQSGTPDALPDSSFVPALESSPHRRGRAILAG